MVGPCYTKGMAHTHTEVRLSLSDVSLIVVDQQQVLGTGLCNYRIVRFLLKDGQQVHIAAFNDEHIEVINSPQTKNEENRNN